MSECDAIQDRMPAVALGISAWNNVEARHVAAPPWEGRMVGFPSPDHPDQAYIHFVGVDPRERGTGLARSMYESFFERMRAEGCTVVHAVTGPVNVGSIAFHRAMGFAVAGPVTDYDGPGADRVVFSRSL